MMTLADYKSSIVSLQIAIKDSKNAESKREWTRALVHAQRRVRQIERRVLVAPLKD